MDTIDSFTTTADGSELHFTMAGQGEPLLLLHGLTGTRDDWKHVFDLNALARRFRVIRPHARGHGRSTNPTGNFTFQECGLDVLHLLNHLGLPRVRAIGLSLGAKTLLHVATQTPERVERLVLVSAAPRFPESTRALFRAWAAAPHSVEERDTLRAAHVHGDDQIAALWNLPARFAEGPNDMSFTPERLGRITARTLVVAGDADPLYPTELAVELQRGIRDSELVLVPGGGHGPIFEGEQRARFVERALAFLAAP